MYINKHSFIILYNVGVLYTKSAHVNTYQINRVNTYQINTCKYIQNWICPKSTHTNTYQINRVNMLV